MASMGLRTTITRTVTVLATAGLLAVGLTACSSNTLGDSGDSPSSSGPSSSETETNHSAGTDESTSTDESTESSDSIDNDEADDFGAPTGEGNSAICAATEAMMRQSANVVAAMNDPEELGPALQLLVDDMDVEAPAEISAAWGTVRDKFNALLTAVNNLDPASMESINKMQAAAKDLTDTEYQDAAGIVDRWVSRNCG